VFSHEHQRQQQGYHYIAGVDEVGRGPLAGPVVAAAVVLPPNIESQGVLQGLTDSKKLSPAKRAFFAKQIQIHAVDYSVGVVSAPVIDRINILQATYVAMWRAVLGLSAVDFLLIDGNKPLPYWDGPQDALIKGDGRSLSIAAASVLAKVARDGMMEAFDVYYPGYGLAKHKGYPTALHRQQVSTLGFSPQHRRSFCRRLVLGASS
jgi:ribonuclease HII